MNARIWICVCLLSLLVSGWSSQAAAFTELSDAQLDAVTAGTATAGIEDDMLRSFDFSKSTRSGRTFDGHGSVSVKNEINQNTLGILQITDSAQSNLRSLVNINAVNSPVQVLLNLNINVNSKVGTMHQLNISGGL